MDSLLFSVVKIEIQDTVPLVLGVKVLDYCRICEVILHVRSGEVSRRQQMGEQPHIGRPPLIERYSVVGMAIIGLDDKTVFSAIEVCHQ